MRRATYHREPHTTAQDCRLHTADQLCRKHHVQMHRIPKFDEVALKR